MIRRINIYAGPGSGKSTLAAKIFADLKIKGHDVEHIPEYIKTWAYAGRKPVSYDQLYVFAKQLHAEDAALHHVKVVVTDSPLLMNTAYSVFYGFRPAPFLVELAKEFERDFPALNFYIDRTVRYQQAGRYQDYQKALLFDEFLLDFLSKNLESPLVHVKVEEYDSILKRVEERVHEAKI